MVDPSLAAGHMSFSGSFTNNRKTLILKHDWNLAMREYMSIQKIQQTIGNFLPLFFTSQDFNTSLPLVLGNFSCKYSGIRSVHGVFCWSRSVGHWVSAPRGSQEVLSDYFQCGISLKQAIIILTHRLFLILAGLHVTRISTAEHALHPSADNYISKFVNFQSRDAFFNSWGNTGKTSKTRHVSPLSDRPKQIVFHCKQLFSWSLKRLLSV